MIINYKHVDVFSKHKFSGNSLTVFMLSELIDANLMQKITIEMRHFESIFLLPNTSAKYEYTAKIFTLEEELDFAGHPLLGAACALHDSFFNSEDMCRIIFQLNQRKVAIETSRQDEYYCAQMNQGVAQFGKVLLRNQVEQFINECNLTKDNIHPDLPLEVVSTGLPYLIVPLISGLDKIKHKNITPLLSQFGAKFVYFYDLNRHEGRTWDNEGLIEDIATGSAAGPLGAYLIKHDCAKSNQEIIIKQGSFLNRVSEIKVSQRNGEMLVSGDVCLVGSGHINL